MKSPEGDKLSQLGIEGLTYNMVDGVPKQTEEYINADADTQKTMHKTCYFQGSNWCEGLSWAAGAVNAKDEWAEREAEKSNARRLWNKNLAYANKNPGPRLRSYHPWLEATDKGPRWPRRPPHRLLLWRYSQYIDPPRHWIPSASVG